MKEGKSYVLGEIVKWFSHDGKQCGDFFLIKVELSYAPSIPVLGIY